MKFEGTNGQVYWANIPRGAIPKVESEVDGYPDIASLEQGERAFTTSIKRILAPVPNPELPMICIGINYAEHAKEAKLSVPQDPVMWYKPPLALANPDEDIPISQTIFHNFLDYEVMQQCFSILVWGFRIGLIDSGRTSGHHFQSRKRHIACTGKGLHPRLHDRQRLDCQGLSR
jgi:hypothetical protein